MKRKVPPSFPFHGLVSLLSESHSNFQPLIPPYPPFILLKWNIVDCSENADKT